MCLALLAGSPIGRVAYLAAGAARVVPVNIAMRDGTLLFRVGTGGLLAAITDRQLLTVEADDIDAESCCGWSVIVTGLAREVPHGPDRLAPDAGSWLRSDAARLVGLTPLEISGRRLPAASSTPPAMGRALASRLPVPLQALTPVQVISA